MIVWRNMSQDFPSGGADSTTNPELSGKRVNSEKNTSIRPSVSSHGIAPWSSTRIGSGDPCPTARATNNPSEAKRRIFDLNIGELGSYSRQKSGSSSANKGNGYCRDFPIVVLQLLIISTIDNLCPSRRDGNEFNDVFANKI